MAITLELEPEAERKLEALAAKTGESRDSLLRNAVSNGLDELESYFSVEETIRRIRNGEEKTYSLEEVTHRLGLDA